MRIILVGISCVGKSTIGKLLANKWNYDFIDFDFEVEKRMNEYITSIKNRCFNEYEYRCTVKHILKEVLQEYKDDVVIAMPPSGLFREYYSYIKLHIDIITVALLERAKKVLQRLVFYDDESKMMEDYGVNAENIDYYYKELKGDIEYYHPKYKKANILFRLNGMNAEDSMNALADCIMEYSEKNKSA